MEGDKYSMFLMEIIPKKTSSTVLSDGDDNNNNNNNNNTRNITHNTESIAV
jgi:hypothetical protein